MTYMIRQGDEIRCYWVDSYGGNFTAKTVYDREDRRFTGLLDADGNRIFATEKAPLGFKLP